MCPLMFMGCLSVVTECSLMFFDWGCPLVVRSCSVEFCTWPPGTPQRHIAQGERSRHRYEARSPLRTTEHVRCEGHTGPPIHTASVCPPGPRGPTPYNTVLGTEGNWK